MGPDGPRVRRKIMSGKWEKRLHRKGVKLYGTRWCALCIKQKGLLAQLCSSWERFYVDCDSLKNVLESSTVKKIPAWRVAGKWYVGAQSEASLEQLANSSWQGMQRWDVAEYTRRHKRRGKWAKEEFADIVKRSILKSKVVHSPQVDISPPSAEGLNHGFMAHSAARNFLVLALAAATFTKENFQKFLDATNSRGAAFKKRSISFLCTTSHVKSCEDLRQRLAAPRPPDLETSETIVSKDWRIVHQDCFSPSWKNSVGIFSRTSGLSGRESCTGKMAKEESTETLDKMADKKVAHLHEILGFTEANRETFRKLPSTILESWGSGLRNLNGMIVRLTGEC
ncbi:hypothetical protein MPTK1_2g00550 [Marchantia polymorpha subsp. ruderalis]|uniref:Glutaredoxin domain-containing protein n=1 Tax=Marchantia polymorpha TaxID=3197 RepID=A0A2R6X9L4_MARPO|nr:hypothetical protein MARPO_0028s0096 [Marchantia polymorpha]BBN00613.1 hypothetical protein Mp_2g00550 [Marchantia polymorpha subsp. ruderalis]|eukprot:PTQ42784.1 hypothetical protein MARPO_0028s0096 [Marchantia polymorpha]